MIKLALPVGEGGAFRPEGAGEPLWTMHPDFPLGLSRLT